MKKQDIAKKMPSRKYSIVSCPKCGNANGSHTNECPRQKGRESLNSTAKHKVDFEGQRSYHEEET